MRPLLKIIIVSLISLVMIPRSVHAQQPPEKWYFGWDNESGQLVTYNPTGNVIPLLTIDPDIPPNGWRLADDRALTVLTVQGVTGLYLLSPNGAQQILPDAAAAGLIPLATRLMIWQEPYLVLAADEGAFSVGLLVDTAQNQVTALTGETLSPIDSWRLSADGQFLRYLSRESRDSNEWTLWERTISTGEERAVYTLNNAFPVIQADRYGDRWITRTLQPDPRLLIHTVIFNDGTSQILAQESVSDPISTYTSYLLFDDDLWVFTAPCSANCMIEKRPLAGGSQQNFSIPIITSPQVVPLARVSDTQMLFLIDDTFWLLNSAAAATEIGKYNGSLTSTPADMLISTNHQWLLSFTVDNHFRLWFLPTAALALENNAAQFITVHYSDAGVLMSQFEPRQTIYYRFADGQAIDLPHGEGDFYSAVLNDGSLLYINAEVNQSLSAGVYRFEPDSGVVTLLIPNLFPLELD